MPYIKKLVMKGFKSFAKETEIIFNNGMNVIVGPNGSGKSNITEAICFVLGRKSAKSMRAEKSANFIFSSAHHKPMWEASVKIIFDNSDKKFALQDKEITIERIVRRNGVSIYKINNEAKARQEILELLITAGINPYGFNIVLQGEIMDTVRISSEERRKVIEEVSGIAVYEQRKEKSLSELEKTEQKLKEADAVLRERTSYLRNLEEERKQALHYQELQSTVKRCKLSILTKKREEKDKQLELIVKETKKHESEKEKIKSKIEEISKQVKETENKIQRVEKEIEISSGVEQEKFYNEITQLRAELAGLDVKKENFEVRLEENQRKLDRAKQEIIEKESELKTLKKGVSVSEKQKDLDKKKQEMEEIEKQRQELYLLKTKLKISINNFEQKTASLNKIKNEYSFIFEEIKKTEQDMNYHEEESCKKEFQELKKEIEENNKSLEDRNAKLLDLEKEISAFSSEINSAEEIKKDIKKIDKICPLCRSKITEEHIKGITKEADEKTWQLRGKIETNRSKITSINQEIDKIKQQLVESIKKERKAEIDLIKLKNIEEKKISIRNLQEDQKNTEKEIFSLEEERKKLEKRISEKKDIEEVYNNKLLEIQEVSSRTEKSTNYELEAKQRDLEKIKGSVKQIELEKIEIIEELKDAEENISEKKSSLEKIEGKEKEFEEKYKKLIEIKNSFQKHITDKNRETLELQNNSNMIVGNINNIMIEKAKVNAEKENLEFDMKNYEGAELISASIPVLEEKLKKSEESLIRIGSINMRALEVYDSVKKEYDLVAEKVTILRNEKDEIMKIIEEVDKKKTKTFMKTLNAINELFNRNFMQLSTKGQAILQLENEQSPFEAGLNIAIKVAKGKYFDISSLSGGEKTLVALSLIFAIQEYKPYPFYIFDEVDAALDKRNSERLASLVKKYMKSGQYVIVTHNDTLISEAPVLYGISMQEGISKIISLEL